MLLAGPISHTSTQYIDFVDFLYFTGFYNDDVIQNKIMAILSNGAFRFAVFPVEIYTKKKQLCYS